MYQAPLLDEVQVISLGRLCKVLNKNSLMYPWSTEGGGKALVLLQVGQSVVVKLHGLAGQPAADLVDALLHPASQAHSPAHELVPSVHEKDFPPGICRTLGRVISGNSAFSVMWIITKTILYIYYSTLNVASGILQPMIALWSSVFMNMHMGDGIYISAAGWQLDQRSAVVQQQRRVWI